MGVVVAKVQSCFAVPCPHLSCKKQCIKNIHNYPLKVHKCIYKKDKKKQRQNTRRKMWEEWRSHEIVVQVQKNLLIYLKGIKTHARCIDIQYVGHHLLYI
jgi:hypothetical protein